MSLEKVITEYRLEVAGLRKDVAEIKSQITSVEETAKTSAKRTEASLNNISTTVSGKLTSAFNTLGTAIVAAFSVRSIVNFTTEAINLAATAEGVKRAFDNLNQPGLLNNLREATKGTVSDLQLMQVALRANNFKIPLNELSRLLKFAQVRATETGQSIDYLVDSIVDGIGRKSPLVLDNLGISAEKLQEEFKKTGDFAKSVGNIIEEEMGEAGDAVLTAAERQAQLNAEFQNLKVDIGTELLPALNNLLGWFNDFVKNINFAIKGVQEYRQELKRTFAAEEFTKEQELFIKFLDDSKGKYNSVEEAAAAYNKVALEQIEAIEFMATDLSKKLGLAGQAEVQSYYRQVAAVNAYVKSLQGQTEEVKIAVEKLEELKRALERNVAAGREATAVIGDFTIVTKGLIDALMNIEKSQPDLKPQSQAWIDFFDKRASEEEAALQRQMEAYTLYFVGVSDILNSINSTYQQSSDYRMQILESELESGLISQQMFDTKVKDLKRQEAQRNKGFAIFDIALKTAQSIMAALAVGPEGVPLAIANAVAGAVQLGKVISEPIPFKKGKVDIDGPGTGESDSILARISKGESVITAKATRKHKALLEAINSNKSTDEITKIFFKQQKSDHALAWDDYRLLLELAKNRSNDNINTGRIVNAITTNRRSRGWN